jgi:hypothetical protein
VRVPPQKSKEEINKEKLKEKHEINMPIQSTF